MEDLVRGLAVSLAGDGAQHARLRQPGEHGRDLGLVRAGVTREIPCAMRDLHPGRRDEVVEHARGARLRRRR